MHRRLLGIVAVLALAAAACRANGTVGPTPSPTVRPTSSSPTTPSPSPSPSPPPSPSPATCAGRTLQAMTLEERVGQLFLFGLEGATLSQAEADAIRAHHFGSVWRIHTTTAGTTVVRAQADEVQALAGEATHGVGFLVAANQEGGLIQALRGPGFSTIPSAEDQAALTTATLRADARTWGAEMLDAGVNLDFAPVADVVPAGTEEQNQPIGALHRGYGSDPAAVGGHVAAFVHGMADAGVATTAKHFPGLGKVVGNTDDVADVVDDQTTPDDPALQSFRSAVDAGVPFVMVALATYTKIDPDHLAAFSPSVMSLLRNQIGFDGVVMSDDLGATKAVAAIDPGTRAIDFLEAGGELVITRGLSTSIQMAEAVVEKAAGDPSFRALVDDAAEHILATKTSMGLLTCG